jgi:hypothetical protein
MAHEWSFEDRAVGRFDNLVDDGFQQAAAGLWMDLAKPALVEAAATARGDTLAPETLAKWDQGIAAHSEAARKISAQLLAAVRKDNPHDIASEVSRDLLWMIARACANELDERLECGTSREDLPALVEVMRDLFGCDQILREASVICEDDDPSADWMATDERH